MTKKKIKKSPTPEPLMTEAEWNAKHLAHLAEIAAVETAKMARIAEIKAHLKAISPGPMRWEIVFMYGTTVSRLWIGDRCAIEVENYEAVPGPTKPYDVKCVCEWHSGLITLC